MEPSASTTAPTHPNGALCKLLQARRIRRNASRVPSIAVSQNARRHWRFVVPPAAGSAGATLSSSSLAVPGSRMDVFPFGRPVVACEPAATGRAAVFVLGAYPSALHVRWHPPQGQGRCRSSIGRRQRTRAVLDWRRCGAQSRSMEVTGRLDPTLGEPLHRSHISMGHRVSGSRSEYSVPSVSPEPTRG